MIDLVLFVSLSILNICLLVNQFFLIRRIESLEQFKLAVDEAFRRSSVDDHNDPDSSDFEVSDF